MGTPARVKLVPYGGGLSPKVGEKVGGGGGCT